MWTYPWDLADCGIAESLEDMKAHGLNGISLITSYHAGRFLQVRSNKRKVYFPEDGVLYIPSDIRKYEGLLIQPKISKFMRENPGFWDEVLKTAGALGMTVSGWTVCLHNTRIGMAHPEVCVHNAFGDSVYYNQCPSNPHVRQYMKALLSDISSSLPFHSLELESMNYMGHTHEFHHEKDGIGLTALDDFLLSLCFCDSCVERARSEGLDILPAKALVREKLSQMCRREKPDGLGGEFMSRGLEFFRDEPALYDYLTWRPSSVTSLVEEVAAVVSGPTKLYFLSLLTADQTWLFGVDLKKISSLCDGTVICCYDNSAEQSGKNVAVSKDSFDCDVLVGMRAFYPEYGSDAEFTAKTQAAKQNGADGFIFYNYGLIPPSQLLWVKRAMDNILDSK